MQELLDITATLSIKLTSHEGFGWEVATDHDSEGISFTARSEGYEDESMIIPSNMVTPLIIAMARVVAESYPEDLDTMSGALRHLLRELEGRRD